MKNLILILVLLLPFQVNAQCKGLEPAFYNVMKNMPKGFTFLKSYSGNQYIIGESGKVWYRIGQPLRVIPNTHRKSGLNFILAKNARYRKTVMFTLVLSKGNTYWIGLSSKDSPKGMIVSLLNADMEELATNYVNNTFYNGYHFKCILTSIYYLIFKFQDSVTNCGAAVLALKTQ